ncbi:protein ENHANCED PSEUDOMONAS SUSCEPTIBILITY 1-like [Vicia villosa]|uniref:protein ENHANCED PSEUDOMONAS SUSCEPTIBILITY 1-like n=1 Tax=Vicia villosa TaxID=3911 RepID=UPI00273AF10B|nr:protein ENHANCED PSEUDOMONAS SUSCEPTIBILITY 1-like [Vicia villosa]
MNSIQVLSTTILHAPNHNIYASKVRTIDLTPWDLQYLPFGYSQIGLLYQHNSDLDRKNQIKHLKQSLTYALEFFPTFTDRLDITTHEDNTISCSIKCNNEGALFVHAATNNISVDNILQPTYLPSIFHSFFPLNKFKNYHGTSQPLLAVQVTELADGIVIACSINHVVVDGTLVWRFINSWAKISKEEKLHMPKSERFFHFSKENIAKLKSKANLEAGTKNISSLQAVFSHIWHSIVRSKNLDPQTEVSFVLDIGVRPRFFPPLPKDYFGNAVVKCVVTMKAGELLEDGGLGKGALEINKKIALHNDEMLKNQYEKWLITPSFNFNRDDNSLVISSSPGFDVYGNDFGWGKPVGVRTGGANKRNGKIFVRAGVEEGSINLEVCLPFENLKAIRNDSEFMDVVSS